LFATEEDPEAEEDPEEEFEADDELEELPVEELCELGIVVFDETDPLPEEIATLFLRTC
jgi:hypothetical protein